MDRQAGQRRRRSTVWVCGLGHSRGLICRGTEAGMRQSAARVCFAAGAVCLFRRLFGAAHTQRTVCTLAVPCTRSGVHFIHARRGEMLTCSFTPAGEDAVRATCSAGTRRALQTAASLR